MSLELQAHAERSIAVGSKSFAAAARLFDADTRRSAVLLYAWCRHCDDVIDGQVLGHELAPPDPDQARARLVELRAATAAVYAGQTPGDPAFAALAEVVGRHGIPQWLPQAHLDGFAMDVEGHVYADFDDLLLYAYRVAGVVGVMMAMLMGVRDEAVLDRACDLGLAFQLSNIARDIVEDAEAGRIYLPQTWLDDAGLPREAVGDASRRTALAGLARRLVDAAEPYYASALAGLPALPPRSAWAIASAHGVYRRIGHKVRARGARAWDTRSATGTAEKLGLLLLGGGRALASRLQQPTARPAGLWQRPRS